MIDEPRTQAYVGLIGQLLTCPHGQEAELLRAQPELVDAELLVAIEQYATHLESRDQSNAEWLRKFAALLILRVAVQEATGTAQFFLETLQLVADSQGNPQQVYPVWIQQQARLNAELLEVMPQVIRQLVAGEAAQRTFVAAILFIFGNLIQRFPLCTRWLNLELGITAYQLVLQVYTREAFPEQWAMTQNNLAIAYTERIRGNRADNLERAIQAAQLALQVRTRDAFPEEWAVAQNNLANAYADRIRGERADNLERAITAYQLALQVHTRDAFPTDWAMTQNNLANAYKNRIRGERADNLERAITAYQLALQVRTRDAFPEEWAVTQNNLASAYAERIQGNRADNLELAIQTYQLALQVCTRDAFPTDWAMTQYNLALTYFDRIQGSRADNLELAITAYQLALQVRTRDAFPEEWAATQNNLGNAYNKRIRCNRADNLELAITAYQLALQVRTRDAFPTDWAATQYNLALTYFDRIQGSRADNLELAITAYQLALQVRTRDAFPEEWAVAQNNLANAYADRIRGERADNLERAITAYQLALQVHTRDAFPTDWAMTQNNLANAYKNRIRGERADNLERAITAAQLALQVHTHEAFPEQWAVTQNNLAIAYKNRIRGERADNLERAITAYQLALEVRTREAFPEQWAMTQNNLAIAYSDRIEGNRAYNLELAITAYQLALQVYTRDAFPLDWGRTQNNLATALDKRIRGDQADNLEQSIQAYELALQVRTRDVFPEQWAATQNNLAFTYSNWVQGERADNLKQAFVHASLEKAVAAYQLALQVYTHDAFPKNCCQTARNLGNLHFVQQSWQSALNAYTTALLAAETLYQSCILLDGKAAELADTADLPRRVAYTYARIGNLVKAIETLEQGRARGLSESLDRDRADLEHLKQLAPNLYNQYKDVTRQFRAFEALQRDHATIATTLEEDRQIHQSLTLEATRLRQSLNAVIDQIRQVENYADFLDQPNFKDICFALRPGSPLVYLVTTIAGSCALVVTSDEISELWLDDITETSVIDLLDNIWFKGYEQFQTDHQAWFGAIDSVTRQLWEPLMQPLIHHLEARNFRQATLIPTGFLSLLPLHAAWTEDNSKPTGRRYASDDLHITYAPNAKSLTAAQAIAQRIGADSILVINDPTYNPNDPKHNLKNAEPEVQTANASFRDRSTILKHADATIEAVKLKLSEAAIVHFACHGKVS